MTQNYKSQILYMAINEYLDEIVSSLNAIEIKSLDRRIDRIVWELTTKIYTSSGYRVDLTWVRDTVCSRIEEIKQQQAFEQKRREEQDRIAAEQKRIAENARLLAAQQKARCDAELKEARRLEAEKKARLTAEKKRIAKEALRIEQQRKTAEIEQKVVEIKQQYRDERASLLELINGDEGKAIIFMLIRPFIAEKFSIHENEVKPERYCLGLNQCVENEGMTPPGAMF